MSEKRDAKFRVMITMTLKDLIMVDKQYLETAIKEAIEEDLEEVQIERIEAVEVSQ